MRYDPATHFVTLTKSETKALMVHASTDETRQHLNAICSDGGTACATDGHRLLMISCGPRTEGKPQLVPLSAMKQAAKHHHVRVEPGRLVCFGKAPYDVSEAPADLADAIIPFRVVDAQFPPFEQVIPSTSDDKAGPWCAFSGQLLGECLTVCGAMASPQTGGVVLSMPAELLDPMRLDGSLADGGVFVSVVMPRRETRIVNAVPPKPMPKAA